MDRFWEKVDKAPGHGPDGNCWLWKGYLEKDGYGVFRPVGTKMIRVHKFSYKTFKGEVPDGVNVCHTCDIRNCVNPDHLWLGTHDDNTQDMYRKGRGRSLSGEDLPQAKLTETIVLAIRSSEEMGKDLAEMYGVSRATISLIRNRKIWTHI